MSDIDGTSVLHRCDNSLCMNPEHLFLGTQVENLADMRNKGRQVHGERHGRAKLTATDVMEIRRLSSGQLRVTQKALAARFGVSQATISKIVRREKWAHLPEVRVASNL